MTYLFKTRIANRANYGGSRAPSAIKYLVFHFTANDGDSDDGNANYFQRVTKTSAHFVVDDDSVTQLVPDLFVAWAVGDDRWSDYRKTGGATMYKVVTNTNSLSIEMCDSKKDGVIHSTEVTIENAIELGKQLMAKYHIPITKVFRHFDVSGKHCPAWLMNESDWQVFKNRLVESEDDMTEEAVRKIVDQALAERDTVLAETYAKLFEYAKPYWTEATTDKIVDGTRPGAPVTRQEQITILGRLGLLKGE